MPGPLHVHSPWHSKGKEGTIVASFRTQRLGIQSGDVGRDDRDGQAMCGHYTPWHLQISVAWKSTGARRPQDRMAEALLCSPATQPQSHHLYGKDSILQSNSSAWWLCSLGPD